MGVSQVMCLKVGLMDNWNMYIFTLGNAKLFSKVLIPIYTPFISVIKIPIGSYPWQHLVLTAILVLLN